MRNFIIVFLLWILPLANLNATSASEAEFTCPVCSTKCKGMEIMSTNSFGGQDRDFFNRANGAQVIEIASISCPKCLYSGYSNDFKKASLSDELKKKILDEKPFEKPDVSKSNMDAAVRKLENENIEKTPRSMPAWAKTDLIVQRMVLEKRSSYEISFMTMTCSWCVRMEENPFRVISGFSKDEEAWVDEKAKALSGDQRPKNRALFEIRLAQNLLDAWDAIPENRRKISATVIGNMLRTHGENELLLASIPKLKTAFPEEEWKKLEQQLRDSIALEGKYQKKAISSLDAVLGSDDELKKLKKGEPAILTYLRGELYRRLGDKENAMKNFNDAEKLPDAPGWLKEYIKEQKALCEKIPLAKVKNDGKD